MIQDIADCGWISRAALDATFQSMIAHDLVFDALVRPRHIGALRERLIRQPLLRAVLDHAGKPDIARGDFDVWARDIQQLARDTSIYCKLSGLLTEAGDKHSADDLAPFVAHIFSCFGPQRVIWGSDWPVLNEVSGYAQWLELSRGFVHRFAARHAADVLANTALRFYRLKLN
jgi:L-fuconolactonase